MRFAVVAAVLAVSAMQGQTLKPADVDVAGALDYGQTSEPTEYKGSPKYSALVFNGASRDNVLIIVKGGDGPAEVALADGALKILAQGTGRLSFTLPDKGSDPEAYYILFRGANGKAGRFTVELAKTDVKSAALLRE